MIYYKKRLSGNIRRKLKTLFNLDFGKISDISFLNLFKKICLIIFLLIAFFYVLYLMLFPVFINEQNIETVINDYLSKHSKLYFDADNLQISPNYKFDINIKANNE